MVGSSYLLHPNCKIKKRWGEGEGGGGFLQKIGCWHRCQDLDGCIGMSKLHMQNPCKITVYKIWEILFCRKLLHTIYKLAKVTVAKVK